MIRGCCFMYILVSATNNRGLAMPVRPCDDELGGPVAGVSLAPAGARAGAIILRHISGFRLPIARHRGLPMPTRYAGRRPTLLRGREPPRRQPPKGGGEVAKSIRHIRSGRGATAVQPPLRRRRSRKPATPVTGENNAMTLPTMDCQSERARRAGARAQWRCGCPL